MTESEWLTSADPQAMLAFLLDSGRASDRKLRLLAVACCRRVWPLLSDRRSREPVEVAERFAEGLAGRQEMEDALGQAGDAYEEVERCSEDAADHYAARTVYLAMENKDHPRVLRCAADASVHGGCLRSDEDVVWEAAFAAESVAQGALVRCLFGPTPFRRIGIPASVLAWSDGLIPRLAQAAREERAMPAGHLDSGRLAVLADALSDAGCTDADLLDHLRGTGPHVRGCHVVYLLLGRT